MIIGGVIALIIITVKNRKKRSSIEKSALDELEELFAEGKVDEEEFRRRRTVLREESKEE